MVGMEEDAVDVLLLVVFDLLMSLLCLTGPVGMALVSLIFALALLNLEDEVVEVFGKLDEVSEPLFCLIWLLLLFVSLDEGPTLAWCLLMARRSELN